MIGFLKAFPKDTISYCRTLFSGKKSAVSRIYSSPLKTLSPEKQQALRALCEQLFKKREMLTSGKLQLIGLANIKKKMGKRWDGLCAVVYDTAEDVIRENIDASDLFVRYTDDTYVIIFSNADLAAGEEKASLIAEEIRRRLFLLDEEALRGIEIRNTVKQARADSLSATDFSDFLESFVDDPTDAVINPSFKKIKDTAVEPWAAIEVNSDNYKPAGKAMQDIKFPAAINFSYKPLWDVKRGALTTYVCCATHTNNKASLIDQHKAFFGSIAPESRIAADIQTLEHVKKELSLMEAEQRKLLIVCPVHYETLFTYESYELYKECLQSIHEDQKQFLILLILKPEKVLNAKDAYWFISTLKGMCRLFFAEVPLKQGVNFQILKAMGLDGVGICIDKHVSEQQVLGVVNNFSATAKSHKIAHTFVLGVSSLSLTTSSVCAGFDYLGGSAIHDAVAQPDTIHKFRHEDIISSLV